MSYVITVKECLTSFKVFAPCHWDLLDIRKIASICLLPDPRRRLGDRPQFRALVIERDRIPDRRAGEAALGRHGQALEPNEAACLPDAA
jgi:hypothetical protein